MQVGGWKSRTTVEDMDLSLRTFLAGWKAVLLANVTCVNEVGGLLLAPARRPQSCCRKPGWRCHCAEGAWAAHGGSG